MLTIHVTSSVGWIGAVCVFLALAGIGWTSTGDAMVRGVYQVMEPAAWLTLVPFAFAALVSGIVVSLTTPWGLFRHYWVVAKLGITAFATIVLLVYMRTFAQMAATAGDVSSSLEAVRNPSPLVHAILALMILFAAAVLAIYKPWGLTPYGQRQRR